MLGAFNMRNAPYTRITPEMLYNFIYDIGTNEERSRLMTLLKVAMNYTLWNEPLIPHSNMARIFTCDVYQFDMPGVCFPRIQLKGNNESLKCDGCALMGESFYSTADMTEIVTQMADDD